MGMSGDLEPAVRAGSTIVRVGTALFERPPGLAVLLFQLTPQSSRPTLSINTSH